MSKLGIHFPNAGFRNLDALWSIPWDHFCVLHLNRAWVPEIRLRYPQSTILVRAFLENWATTEPVGWADSIAQWANELRPFNIEITFANEQNLAAEGHPLAARAGAEYPPAHLYQDILEWDVAVIRELRRQIPWAAIHFPALSQGHSDDQADAGYVGFEILRDAVEMCDVLDAHIYWDESRPGQRKDKYLGERYTLLHSLFPSKPIYISECGTVAASSREEGVGIADWIDALPDYVVGACWFIWDSDRFNQPWILLDRPASVEVLRALGLSHVLPPPVGSVFSPVSTALRLITSTTAFTPTRHSPAGHPPQEIGYGHRIQPGEQFSDPLSEEQARRLLQEDLAKCLQELEQYATSPLTFHQKTALICFIYNTGISALTPALLDELTRSDAHAAADMIRRSSKARGDNSLENVRRREMESALLERGSLSPISQRASGTTRSSPENVLACCISSTASWISVEQGQNFKVIGVWYYPGSDETTTRETMEPDAASQKSCVYVKVEDETAAGIPAELVVRRWGNPSGECEPQFSDAFGMVAFELGAGSAFSPREGPGPDRIHVGDCVIAGLGIPVSESGGLSQALYVIRIRKIRRLLPLE